MITAKLQNNIGSSVAHQGHPEVKAHVYKHVENLTKIINYYYQI